MSKALFSMAGSIGQLQSACMARRQYSTQGAAVKDEPKTQRGELGDMSLSGISLFLNWVYETLITSEVKLEL